MKGAYFVIHWRGFFPSSRICQILIILKAKRTLNTNKMTIPNIPINQPKEEQFKMSNNAPNIYNLLLGLCCKHCALVPSMLTNKFIVTYSLFSIKNIYISRGVFDFFLCNYPSQT